MRNLIVVVFVALALSTFGFTAGPQAVERDSWTGPIAPGAAVRVHNAFGDVRLRHGGSEHNLEVAAVMQQLAVDGSKLVLEVEVTDDAAVITVVRYDHLGARVKQIPRGDKARADLAVLVPEGAATRAETTSGLIEARGVRNDIDLHTISGTIRVAKNHGRITAHSEGGEMEITLDAGATKKPQSFSSVTGPITVFTAPTNDLDITIATSGAFTTDFSLDVAHHDHEEPNKTATTTIGNGGQPLTLTSKRGDLAIRRTVTGDTD